MKVGLSSVNPDIGYDTDRRNDLLAELKRRWNADRFDGCVDAASASELLHLPLLRDVLAVDDGNCNEAPGAIEAIVIEIDHDDLCGRIELSGEQRRKAD